MGGGGGRGVGEEEGRSSKGRRGVLEEGVDERFKLGSCLRRQGWGGVVGSPLISFVQGASYA